MDREKPAQLFVTSTVPLKELPRRTPTTRLRVSFATLQQLSTMLRSTKGCTTTFSIGRADNCCDLITSILRNFQMKVLSLELMILCRTKAYGVPNLKRKKGFVQKPFLSFELAFYSRKESRVICTGLVLTRFE